ncbi:Uncharacterized protein FWK35_00013929 [Aphis craccivora]|uniref:Uncharacterized protein n=1 Tax=Aphis craccivora TaxID=307492 RepID=A0A6G0Z5L8_APHCR|nr:Uncharacterized protein FWK35_00013929 [Aphis craccivora]
MYWNFNHQSSRQYSAWWCSNLIAVIYSPPKHNVSHANFFNTINNNFIIGGDYNAKYQNLNSDHSSVILIFNDYPQISIVPPKLFYASTDRYKYHDLVNQNLHLNVRLKSKDDIDTAVNYCTNVIQTAAWSSNTPKKHVHNNNTNSLSINIRILIAEKRRARAIYQRTPNTLKKVLLKVKNRSFENFLTNLSIDNDSLWKATKLALHYIVTTPHIKRSDGSYASSNSQKAELFKNHLFNVSQPN